MEKDMTRTELATNPAVKPGTLIQSPDRAYNSPAEILGDERLSEEDKRKALQNWEADIKSELRADDENMTATVAKPGTAPEELIKSVQRAERKLEEGEANAGRKDS
jgi:hypothetical protein